MMRRRMRMRRLFMTDGLEKSRQRAGREFNDTTSGIPAMRAPAWAATAIRKKRMTRRLTVNVGQEHGLEVQVTTGDLTLAVGRPEAHLTGWAPHRMVMAGQEACVTGASRCPPGR